MEFTTFCREDEKSRSLAGRISRQLQDHGWIRDEMDPELVICVGGDGTILRAIHKYLPILPKTLFVGIHTGTLGFFTDYTRKEEKEFINALLKKDYQIEASPLLKACLFPSQKVYYAFNEFRLGNFSKTVVLDIHLDGELLETSQGCGVCISSQAGSTGANRALHGAVVDNGLSIMQLCEIMPISHCGHHSLRNPYIMQDSRVITIRSRSLDRCVLSFDHLEVNLPPFTEAVEISTSDLQVCFARYKPYSYLKRIKTLY